MKIIKMGNNFNCKKICTFYSIRMFLLITKQWARNGCGCWSRLYFEQLQPEMFNQDTIFSDSKPIFLACKQFGFILFAQRNEHTTQNN